MPEKTLTEELIADLETRMAKAIDRYDSNDGSHESQRDAYEHAYDISSDVAYKAIEILKALLKETM
jgi:hypothetical protein